MYSILQHILRLKAKIEHDHISAYAGQAAYFFVLCILPFLIFLLTVIRYLPIEPTTLLRLLFSIVPKSYDNLVYFILNDIHLQSGTTFLSFSLILTIWTAGKGTLVLSNGLDLIYNLQIQQNYFKRRIKAMFHTLFLAVIITTTMLMLAFSPSTHAFIIFFIVFTLLYVFLPAVHQPILYQLPGSLFTSLTWMISAILFSFYTNTVSVKSYMYGSLSYIILFLIYLHLLMYLFFIGAEINYYITTICDQS